MATVINSCVITSPDDQLSWNYIHLVSFAHLKPYPKTKIYNDKVICTFVILPHKPRFQTETWIKTIRHAEWHDMALKLTDA